MATNTYPLEDLGTHPYPLDTMSGIPYKKNNAYSHSKGCKFPCKSIVTAILVPAALVASIGFVVYYANISSREPLRRDYCPRNPELALGKPGIVRCFRKVEQNPDGISVVKGTETIWEGELNSTVRGDNREASLTLEDEWITFKLSFTRILCTDEGKYLFNINDRYHRPIEINIKVFDKEAHCDEKLLQLGRADFVQCGFCPPDDVKGAYLERKSKWKGGWSKIWSFDLDQDTALEHYLDNRTSVSLIITHGLTIFRFHTNPTWCSDYVDLRWTVVTGPDGKETSRSVPVFVTSPIMRCPSKLFYNVGEHGEFECKICVNTSSISYTVNRIKGNDSAEIFSHLAEEGEEIGNKTEDSSIFIKTELEYGILKLEFEFIAFCINEGVFFLEAGKKYGRNISIVIEDTPLPPKFVSSDALMNNSVATLRCEASTGCTAHELVINQLGVTLGRDSINQTKVESLDRGEIFGKTFNTTATWDVNVTSALHDTIISCQYTYEDSKTGSVTLTTEYKAYVLKENFCTLEMKDCNFAHPYTRKLFLACRGIATPTVMPCPPTLAFYPEDCFGKCSVYFGALD